MEEKFESPSQGVSTAAKTSVLAEPTPLQSEKVTVKETIRLPIFLAFAIPLLLVLGVMHVAQTRLDIFDASSRLETRLERARQLGFSINSETILPPSSVEGDKCYDALTSWYPQLRVRDPEMLMVREPWAKALVPFPKQMQKPWKFTEPLNAESLKFLANAKRLASFKSLSKMVDLDQPFYAEDESDLGKTVSAHASALIYQVKFMMERKQFETAIEPLRYAYQLVRLLKGDPTGGGVSRLLSQCSQLKAASVKLIPKLQGNELAQERVHSLMKQGNVVVDLDRHLQAEFRLTLAFYRNFDSTVGRLLESDNTQDVVRDRIPTRLLRTGLPKTTAGRSMLSRCIQNYLDKKEILRDSTSLGVASKRIDELEEDNMWTMTGRATIFTMWGSYIIGSYNRHLALQIMFEWAAEIAAKHGESPPDSLPAREQKDGTGIYYRPIEGGIQIYSGGPDGIDDGGPDGTLDASYNDDFGLKIVFQEPKPKQDSPGVDAD